MYSVWTGQISVHTKTKKGSTFLVDDNDSDDDDGSEVINIGLITEDAEKSERFLSGWIIYACRNLYSLYWSSGS